MAIHFAGEALERAIHHFSNPFKGYESFFGKDKLDFKSSKKIKLPHGHELHNKVKNMRLIEFNQIENFERYAVLIEDRQGNKSVILMNKDYFKPDNRADVPNHGEPLSHAVFGKASSVGMIKILQTETIENPFKQAEKIAGEEVRNMKFGCEVSGVKADSIIKLSGASAIVIPNPDKPESVGNENLQHAVAFLFGAIGPFKEMVVFPGQGQESLIENIKMAGGKTLLKGSEAEPKFEITFEQFLKLNKTLMELARTNHKDYFEKLFPGNKTDLFIKAFLSNLPVFIEMFKDPEVRIGNDELEIYLKKSLREKLKRQIESHLSGISSSLES